MTGISVGSVSVDVVPDAGQFATRLKSALSGVGTTIGDQLGSDIGSRVTARISDSISKGVVEGGTKAQASSASAGDSAGGKFADSFKARVKAALDALPDVKINADSSEADRKLAELRAQLDELSGKTVGVDLSDADARAKLDSLKSSLDELGHKSESVRIKVDTAAASAELAAFKAELDSATSGSGQSGGGGGFFSSISSSAESASASITPMIAGIALVGPALIPIAAAASAGIGAIATTALASGAALGVLYLGLADVVKAVSAMSAAQAAAGSDAAASAKAQEAAANQVRSSEASLANAESTAAAARVRAAQAVVTAQQNLANAVRTASDDQITEQENLATAADAVTQARVTGAQQVAAAEQSLQSAEGTLTNAVYTETQAQQALIAARQTAQRQLESYAQQVSDGALTQRQDILNVETAQNSLNATLANPAATQLQREQAQLSYDQAVQAQKDQAQNYQNLLTDAAAATKAGVDGATAVVNAQHQVLTAQQGVAAAQKAVADAATAVAAAQVTAAKAVATALQHQGDVERQVANQRINDGQKISSAQQGLANAQAAQAQQEVSSAFAVSQAQAAVTQALYAQQTAATGLSSSQQALAAAMANLSPAGREFATFIGSTLMPAFQNLKAAAETALLPGLQAGITALTPLLPGLTKFVSDLAGTMGTLFEQAGKALTSPFWIQWFTWFGSVAGPILQQVGSIIGNVVTGIAGLLQAFSPLTTTILGAIDGLTGKFAAFATNTAPGSPLERFVSYAGNALSLVGQLLASLAPALVHIGQAVAGAGIVDLGVLADILKVIAAIPVGVLQGILAVLIPLAIGVKLLGPVLKFATSDLAKFIGRYVAGMATWIATTTASVAESTAIWVLYAAEWLAGTATSIATWIAEHAAALATWIATTAASIATSTAAWVAYAAEWIASTSASVATFVAEHAAMAAGFIAENTAMIASATAAFIAENIASLGIIAAITAIVAAVVYLATHWKQVWAEVKKIVSDAWTLVIKPVLGWITGAGQSIGDFFTNTVAPAFVGAWNTITGAFKSAWDWVSGEFKTLWSDAKTGVGAIITDPLNAVARLVTGIWADIKKAFISGVDDVIKVINSFLDAIDSVVAAVPGLPNKLLPDIPLLTVPGNAAGGIIPGYAPGVDSVLSMVSPGEAILRPEVTRWLGADTIHGWNRAAVGGGLPGFASGGVMGLVAKTASSGFSFNPLHDVAKLGAEGLEALLRPIKALADTGIDKLPNGFVKTLAKGILTTIFGSAPPPPAASNPNPVGSEVGRWGPDVAEVAAMLGIPSSVVPGVLSLINSESGGDPNSINLTDSNAQAGYPSQGLMQTIPQTFEAYRSSSLPDVITDPLANIFAGMNYALHNYGLGMLMSGGRHDAGGGYIGYDSGGWLQPGFTPVWNGTGQPERVLSPQQVQSGGADGELLASMRNIEALLRANPTETGEFVAAGVSGEFERAAIAHARATQVAIRTGVR